MDASVPLAGGPLIYSACCWNRPGRESIRMFYNLDHTGTPKGSCADFSFWPVVLVRSCGTLWELRHWECVLEERSGAWPFPGLVFASWAS